MFPPFSSVLPVKNVLTQPRKVSWIRYRFSSFHGVRRTPVSGHEWPRCTSLWWAAARGSHRAVRSETTQSPLLNEMTKKWVACFQGLWRKCWSSETGHKPLISLGDYAWTQRRSTEGAQEGPEVKLGLDRKTPGRVERLQFFVCFLSQPNYIPGFR